MDASYCESVMSFLVEGWEAIPRIRRIMFSDACPDGRHGCTVCMLTLIKHILWGSKPLLISWPLLGWVTLLHIPVLQHGVATGATTHRQAAVGSVLLPLAGAWPEDHIENPEMA